MLLADWLAATLGARKESQYFIVNQKLLQYDGSTNSFNFITAAAGTPRVGAYADAGHEVIYLEWGL
jgi:hypothetical protein